MRKQKPPPSETINIEQLSRRIKDRLRLIFNEGIGHFALGIAFLTLTAIATRVYIDKSSSYQECILQNVGETLGTKHEPSFRTEHLGLIGSILTPINRQSQDWQCIDTTKKTHECEIMRYTHKIFQILVGTALNSENFSSEDVERKISKLMFMPSPQAMPYPIRKNWIQSARIDIERVVSAMNNSEALMVENCSSLHQDEVSDRIKSLGAVGCTPREVNSFTTVLVPPQIELSNENNGTTIACAEEPGSNLCYQSRVHRAIHLSSLLETTLRPFDLPLSSETSTNLFHFVQAYFISVDSVLRIWSRRNPKHETELPPTRLWASTNYFDKFWVRDSPPSYTSMAYLDLGGHGIVRTVCSPVPTQDSSEDFLGIFCTDFSLPESAFRRAISGQPFLETALVTLIAETEVLPENVVIEQPRESFGEFPVCSSSFRLTGIPEGEARKVLSTHYNNKQHVIWQKVTELSYNDKKYFLLPLGSRRTDTGGEFRGLLVAPKIPEPPNHILISGALAWFLGATFLATSIFAAISARKNTHASRRHAILRNLQIGLVHVDHDDLIIEANDRAEEILSVKLPKHSTNESTAGHVNFRDLINSIVVISDETGGARSWATIKYEDVCEKRSRDEISTYYARLEELVSDAIEAEKDDKSDQGDEPGKWIKVSGSPMLISELHLNRKGSRFSKSTFGVIDNVSKRLATEFEGIWGSRQVRSQESKEKEVVS